MKIGDKVTLNDPRSTDHGSVADIVEIDESRTRSYRIQIRGLTLWYGEDKLSAESQLDFSHSGLGIGGLGSHAEPLIAPTAAQINRVERREREARYCKRCGQSNLNGAMFTTAPWSGCCDDCF